ncbi:MAG: hypothetical protein H6703_12610 [Myxococcales bacterium]|nr:hypothetical protein [Myxococcales bacterium]
MGTQDSIDGFSPLGPLADGRIAVHRAHDGRDGVLTRIPGADPVAARETTRRLRELTDPHLWPVLAAGVDAHGAYLITPPVPAGGTLADRPAATPADARAIGAALVEALAAAHRAGLTHGALDAAHVCLADGAPRLTGLGLATLRGARVDPADDLRALAALWRALDPEPPATLRALLARPPANAEAFRRALDRARRRPRLRLRAAPRPPAPHARQRRRPACAPAAPTDDGWGVDPRRRRAPAPTGSSAPASSSPPPPPPLAKTPGACTPATPSSRPPRPRRRPLGDPAAAAPSPSATPAPAALNPRPPRSPIARFALIAIAAASAPRRRPRRPQPPHRRARARPHPRPRSPPPTPPPLTPPPPPPRPPTPPP